MLRQMVYLLIEPAQTEPIWFLCVEESLKKICQKKHLLLVQLDDLEQLEKMPEKPISVLVLCSQNNWPQHVVTELCHQQIMPILVGVVPSQFGDSVSGIYLARRIFIEKVIN